MAKTQEIIDGLAICERYREKPNSYNTGAEHDQLYCYATDSPLSDEDVTKMIELGWFQEDCQWAGTKMVAADYDPEEGWSIFT